MMQSIAHFCALVVLLSASTTGVAAEAIRVADEVHLGVASCATSVCHGKLSPQDDENVWLNEYRIWSADDRHAQAYRTLETAESKAIAQKLGLASAATAKICLDCHADNVPQDKRGPKFQIRDGVGCEGCHGGSQKWIESHAEPDATHADNLAKGMYQTEDPLSRASICLSCHLGTKDQFATHEIMGAGHPRLSFELEAFTANQPAHYDVDEDYAQRKGKIEGFNLWLTGQLESAERYLTLIRSPLFDPPGMMPEFAFYDCHSCHHPMDDLRWTRAQAGANIEPGSLRLQDQHLRVLVAVTRILEPGKVEELVGATNALVKAGQQDTAAARSAAQTLLAWLQARQTEWAAQDYPAATVRSVRKQLLADAARGSMADFSDAEQVFLAVESLSLYLGDADMRQGQLDALYKSVESDETYDPASFRQTAGRVRNAFP